MAEGCARPANDGGKFEETKARTSKKAGTICISNLVLLSYSDFPPSAGIGGGPSNSGASSGTSSAARHPSRPGRQTRLFRPNDPSRTRAARTIRSNGPTGVPLIATWNSSVAGNGGGPGGRTAGTGAATETGSSSTAGAGIVEGNNGRPVMWAWEGGAVERSNRFSEGAPFSGPTPARPSEERQPIGLRSGGRLSGRENPLWRVVDQGNSRGLGSGVPRERRFEHVRQPGRERGQSRSRGRGRGLGEQRWGKFRPIPVTCTLGDRAVGPARLGSYGHVFHREPGQRDPQAAEGTASCSPPPIRAVRSGRADPPRPAHRCGRSPRSGSGPAAATSERVAPGASPGATTTRTNNTGSVTTNPNSPLAFAGMGALWASRATTDATVAHGTLE